MESNRRFKIHSGLKVSPATPDGVQRKTIGGMLALSPAANQGKFPHIYRPIGLKLICMTSATSELPAAALASGCVSYVWGIVTRNRVDTVMKRSKSQADIIIRMKMQRSPHLLCWTPRNRLQLHAPVSMRTLNRQSSKAIMTDRGIFVNLSSRLSMSLRCRFHTTTTSALRASLRVAALRIQRHFCPTASRLLAWRHVPM